MSKLETIYRVQLLLLFLPKSLLNEIPSAKSDVFQTIMSKINFRPQTEQK